MIQKFERKFGYIISDNNRLPYTSLIKKYFVERMYAEGYSKIAIAEKFELKRDTINKILATEKCNHYKRIAELISNEDIVTFNKEFTYEQIEKIAIEKTAKRFSLYETIDLLKKEPGCRLWNKQFNKFTNKDWLRINKIYETKSVTAHN
ncbi:hypothetical protein [Flavobacterium sp.]|uniref:hypothetical protein n=1 Tax=Flavobacterium sp. TaxID=239 RepID=UPI0025D806FF|nr:hypothetical protein [Flavobacterium sp.]